GCSTSWGCWSRASSPCRKPRRGSSSASRLFSCRPVEGRDPSCCSDRNWAPASAGATTVLPRRLRALANGHADLQRLLVPQDLEGRRLPRRQSRNLRQQRGAVAGSLAFDFEDDVACLQSGTIRRAVLEHAADQHAVHILKRKRNGKLRGELLRLDAQPSARHLAIADDLLEHGARDRDRDREADALRAAVLRIDRTVDADQIAPRVDQRTAGIAQIDRRIGLNEILEAIDAQMVSTQRTDDAVCNRVAETERVAQRKHRVADL